MEALGVSDDAELQTVVKHLALFSRSDGKIDGTTLNSLAAITGMAAGPSRR